MSSHCEVFGEPPGLNQSSKWSQLFKLIEANLRASSTATNYILIIDAVKPFRYYEDLIRSKPGYKSILVVVEQPSVNPVQHKKKFRNLFDHVFVSSHELAEKYGGIYFTFPLHVNAFQEIKKKETNGKILFGIVATSKNSLVKSSLYKLRPAAINFLTKSDQIIFGGKDFNSTRISNLRMDLNYCIFLLKNGILPHLRQVRFRKLRFNRSRYLGEVETKDDIFKLVDVVLCFENDYYEFSEKFADAISAGKVPLYIGPNLVRLGVPKSVYIKSEPNFRKLKKILKEINPELINSKLDAITYWREFGLKPWREENAFHALSTQITSLIDDPFFPKR